MANVANMSAVHKLLYSAGLDEVEHRNRLMQALGASTLNKWRLLTKENITAVAKTLRSNDLPDDQRLFLNQVEINLLITAVEWVQLKRKSNIVLDDQYLQANMSPEILSQFYEDHVLETTEDKLTDDVKHPDKFDPIKWVSWYGQLMANLMARKGCQKIPLAYIAREKDVYEDNELQAMSEEDRLINGATLSGTLYRQDNKSVFLFLKGILINTDAWPWIKEHDHRLDGRQAIKALRLKYDGMDAKSSRRNQALQLLDSISYRDEKSFSFEKYITTLKDIFQTLADAGEPKFESEKRRILLNKIFVRHSKFEAAIEAIKKDPTLLNDFDGTARSLSESVQEHLKVKTVGNNFDRRVAGFRGNRGAGRGGRFIDGRGRGRGRGRGIRRYENGVDVTQLGRLYSYEEYAKLSDETKEKIRKLRRVPQHDNANNYGRTQYDANYSRRNGKVKFDQYANNPEGDAYVSEDKSGKNDTQANRGGFGRNAYSSNKSFRTRMVVTDRKVSLAKDYKHEDDVGLGLCELDSHADTTCVGRNFRVTHTTDHTADVSPFHSRYEKMLNVPIVTATTAVTLPTGECIIVEIHQCLYFPDMMESLLNPNQIRCFGLVVEDNPFSDKPLSIYDPRTDVSILMEVTDGGMIGFRSKYPTDEELDNCRWVSLTNDYPWDPSNIRKAYAQDGNEAPATSRVQSSVQFNRKCRVDAPTLANRWMISTDQASQTLQATTQFYLRSEIFPLKRRVRTDLWSTGYNRLRTDFFSDTVFSKVKSLIGNSCFQIFASDDFVYVYPLKTKAEAGLALKYFNEDVGVPNTMTVDNSQEQTGKKSSFYQRNIKTNVVQRFIEPYTYRQNRSEAWVGRLKTRVKQLMLKQCVPQQLWDFAFIYQSEIMNRTARPHGRTAYEVITGNTPDISEWLDFDFYQAVHYIDHPDDVNNHKIGRWLGIAHRVGTVCCYYVLKENGQVIARTSVVPIPPGDIDAMKDHIAKFDNSLEDHLRNTPNNISNVIFFQDEWSEPSVTTKVEEDPDVETYDRLVGAELILPHDDRLQRARVIKRSKDENGNLIGRRSQNLALDTSRYDVMFPDGEIVEYGANIIAENIYMNSNDQGFSYNLFEAIIDHKKLDDQIEDRRMTTKGWEFLVQWKDGATSWHTLAQLKESFPVDVAEYAISRNIHHERAFSWWINTVLKRKEYIVKKVNRSKKYWNTHAKYGVRLPKTVQEALDIDRMNKNDLWLNAILKEIKNVRIAFELCEHSLAAIQQNPRLLPGYQQIQYHFVFDVKMDFTRKARLVAGGHVTEVKASDTYSSVVSRDSVRIIFLLAQLLDLNILSADVGNAYLNAPCREKIYCRAGKEFGADWEGRVLIIRRALYGLKTSGASWRATLAQTLINLGFRPTKADPDTYLMEATKQSGERYYQYCIVYVDDLLLASENPSHFMDKIASIYRLKDPPSIPTRFLGADISRMQLADGTMAWAMSSDTFVSNALKNLGEVLNELTTANLATPWKNNYRPEVDVTNQIEDENEIHRYQSYIGILRWAVELGRMDILHEISKLSQYSAAPREGHMDALLRIFAYLNKHRKSSIVFDPMIPQPIAHFNLGADWHKVYGELLEPIPDNLPEPRGPPVHITCFCDADHASNLVTRRSHTGIVIYINNAPIIWYSKRQNTVESSTFGSEFIALKTATEMIQSLRYKLRSFGVNIDGPADIYCDNASVVNNAAVPESTLAKKHISICYHKVRESVAMGMIQVAWIPSEQNVADLFTKSLPVDQRRYFLMSLVYNHYH